MNVDWIKIDTRIFDNRKIKYFLDTEDGYAIFCVWIHLLVLAANVNDGGRIYLTKTKLYTPEGLAVAFNMDDDIVRDALEVFQDMEMIDENYTILNWDKYQNVEGMERIREQTNERVRRHRENKLRKELEEAERKMAEDETLCNVTETLPETLCNATDKNRKDKKRKEENINNIAEQARQIVSHLNEVAGTAYKSNSKTTLRHISARLAEGYLLEEFYAVIDKKWREWGGSDMEKYMRPETLFGTKFEGYLNEPETQKRKKGGSQQTDGPVDWDSFV